MDLSSQHEDQSLEDFIEQHSASTNEGTAAWTYRFGSRGHDVLFLILSGTDSTAILTAAAKAAGIEANVNETYH